MSPRSILGERFCEICGSLLRSYQLRFCSVPCSLSWLHSDRPSIEKAAATKRRMVADGEMPPPPRATGPFRYSEEMREAIHLVKTGTRIADLTPEQATLYREYNREHAESEGELRRASQEPRPVRAGLSLWGAPRLFGQPIAPLVAVDVLRQLGVAVEVPRHHRLNLAMVQGACRLDHPAALDLDHIALPAGNVLP